MSSQVTSLFEHSVENPIQIVIPDNIQEEFNDKVFESIQQKIDKYFSYSKVEDLPTKNDFNKMLQESHFHHNSHIKYVNWKYIVTEAGIAIINRILLPFQIVEELDKLEWEKFDFRDFNNYLHIYNLSTDEPIEVLEEYWIAEIAKIRKVFSSYTSQPKGYEENLQKISKFLDEFPEKINAFLQEKENIQKIFNAFRFTALKPTEFRSVVKTISKQEDIKHLYLTAQNKAVWHSREMLNQLDLGKIENQDEDSQINTGEIKTSKLRDYFSKLISKIFLK